MLLWNNICDKICFIGKTAHDKKSFGQFWGNKRNKSLSPLQVLADLDQDQNVWEVRNTWAIGGAEKLKDFHVIGENGDQKAV